MLWDTLTFNDLEEMRRDLDAMFGLEGAVATSFPLLNVYENRDEVLLVAQVPGIRKEDLEIRFEDGTVTLAGDREPPAEEAQTRRFLRHERGHGRFEKIFRFPAKVVTSDITAKLENGILVVRAPKAEEAKPQQITIQTE
jgi:HSP20 family protein